MASIKSREADQLSSEKVVDGVPISEIRSTAQVKQLVQEEEEIKLRHWYDSLIKLVWWYPGYLYGKTERTFLFKLDAFILTYICLSYFTKALDKNNISYSYVSGMREEISFNGNDLSYAKSLYSAGYIVSMCIGTLLVTQKWSRLMLPIFEVLWGTLTFCAAAAKKPEHIFAIRFLVGFCEGVAFPSSVYILSTWYRRDEIYRRVMVFSVSASLGSMFSGYLQAAAYDNLSGKGGLSGWKWGFILNGIITVIAAIYGFAIFPGPLRSKEQSTKKPVWWMKETEYQLAMERQEKSGIDGTRQLDWNVVKKTFFNYKVHFFATFFTLLNIVALPDGTAMPLWLDWERENNGRFTVSQVDNYTTFQGVVSIVGQFFLAGLADSYSIYPFLSIVQICFIISYASLAVWNIPYAWKWICMLLIGLDTVNQAIISGWISRSCRHDSRERAFVIGYSDAVSQATNIWTNIVFYPTSKAPEFHLGFIISAIAAVIMLFLPALEFYGTRYDEKKRIKELDQEVDSSSAENVDLVRTDNSKLSN